MSAEDLLVSGEQLLREQRWDDAETAFTDFLAQNPRASRAYWGRAQARIGRRDWGPASDDLDDAERYGLTDHPELHRLRAMANYFGGYSPLDRLDDADRLIALAPEHPDGWFYRGDSLSDLGDREAGIAAFDRAIALNPQHADAYFQRGNAWDGLDEQERATADFRRSTEIGSIDPNVYHRKGHYYEKRDDYERAAAEFRRAIELEPENERHYYCGGNILRVLEDEGLITGEEVEALYAQRDNLLTGSEHDMTQDRHQIYHAVQEHFGQTPLEELALTERTFPPRAMPDIQGAFNELDQHGYEVVQFWATTQHGTEPVQNFTALYSRDRSSPVKPSNPRYKEYDIGEDEPFRCLKDGVWLLKAEGCHMLALLDTSNCYTVRVELAAQQSDEGRAATERFFKAIEDSIQRSRCYRGKVLSMEVQDSYSGNAPGLLVHRLKAVSRDHIILPQQTLDLLDRNVINFARRRQQLLKLGMSTKKGLLFYGPPGVGKTHTVHYLATNLPGHTTLLITGEQVGNLSEYMTLARLYQPCMVVVEDVDLIARHREEMRSSGEEVMLNKLLNEMDGIKSDAEIVFVLTTNRASVLEEALASRPGRIDQAIEFPLPNAEGRDRLVRLYSLGVTIADEVVRYIVTKTDYVSASFIKELMRRCVQFALDRTETAESIELADVDAALEELLVTGGSLNQKLLGAGAHKEGREIGFPKP